MGQLALFGFPVFTSLFSLTRIASGYASAKRVLAIINAKTDLDAHPEGYKQAIRGDIVFENVDFGYQGGRSVVQGVSFSVKAGQTVAIVGQTGAGKTTLTKLINRTYDVNAGRVLVDGVDVREWDLEALRSQISVIEQDIFLFSRTIAQNIGFGDDELDLAKIQAAAQQAQAHEFIMSFPEGYETLVGQRGVTLSGGQRQRLAIARAFESDPPVLILDDSTSAIDSATEDKIQKAIWAASKGRTMILITHRLSQIRWADHIIVLKQGRVVAQGKHEDLLQSSEAYRRIFARYEAPVSDSLSEPIHPARAGEEL
jgi:ATP-binding cassette subfamily B protein